MSLSSPWSLPILVTVVGLAIVASDVTSDATVIETPAANHASQAPARDSHEPSTGTAAGVSVVPAPGPTSNPYTPSVTVPVGTGFIERRSAVPVQAPTQQAPAQYAPVQGYTPVNQYPPAARSYPSGLYPPVPQSAWPQQSSSVHRTPAPPSVQPQPVCEPQYKFSATASIPHPTRIPAGD